MSSRPPLTSAVGRRREVVGRVVDEVVAVVVAAAEGADVVPVRVREAGDVAIGPAEVRGLGRADHRHVAGRAAGRVGERRVGAVVGEPHLTVGLGLPDRERVAQAHRVDLGQGLVVGVQRLVEQVAGGDRVRAPDAHGRARLGQRADAQDLAVRVVRVGRGGLRVVGDLVGALVHRRVAEGGAAAGVVARRHVTGRRWARTRGRRRCARRPRSSGAGRCRSASPSSGRACRR